MQYYINYTKEGKILGFTKGNTNLSMEIPNAIWFEAQSFNKILFDGDSFSFCNVDWRTHEEIEAQAQAAAKVARTEALANLTVEVNGHVFDANETARTNMIAAILSADLIGKTEESWKLADNSIETITLNELKQALALTIQAVGEIVKG